MHAAPIPSAQFDDALVRAPRTAAASGPNLPQPVSDAAPRTPGNTRGAAAEGAPGPAAPPHGHAGTNAAAQVRGPKPYGPRPSSRSGPPGRRDSRRPGTHVTSRPGAAPGRPSASALRAAAARERERQPPYWFASRLLLVLSGQRPVHTLLQHTRGPAYEELTSLASHAPLRPRGADRTSPEVLDARGSRPRDGVIEAFARIVTGDRQRAIAFRLELCADHRWRCSAVELDGQSTGRSRP
ncbi:hypothetical protein GCM10012287_53950 [Streptomyces daqingensis]|uniref:Uncharacterized protein n=1 Tax=Streptomyces daqingensis TaxID=1472640 RepID=A0ABQ2MUD5_9ACTN|nr:hypothetical protein GCM10012287_53950 [Streptomyces daqingensis]